MPRLQVLVLLRDPGVPISMENIDKAVQCQLLHGSPSENLLRILQVRAPSALYVLASGDGLIQTNTSMIYSCLCICVCESMQDIYVPLVFDNEAAQVSVTKDFREDFDKFMATLTESIYEAKGQTLLYLPPLHYTGSIKDLALNKELTQRLEQIIIRWTRQIKEARRHNPPTHTRTQTQIMLHKHTVIPSFIHLFIYVVPRL